MRKLTYLLVAVALVALAALTIQDAPATAEASIGARAGQVAICHYPGHDGDKVLNNQSLDRSRAYTGCNGDDGVRDNPVAGPNASGDGIVLFVGSKACEKAHQAAPSGNGTTCEG